MSISHRCENCNRTLRDTVSMAIGYGPVCYKKLFGIKLKKSTKNKIKHSKYISEMENLDEVFKDV